MDHTEQEPTPRPRRRKRSKTKYLLLLIVAVAIAALAFLAGSDPRFSLDRWLGKTDQQNSTSTTRPPATDSPTTVTIPGQAPSTPTTTETAEKSDAEQQSPAAADDADADADADANLTGEQVCAREGGKVEAFYTHLDQQPYIKAFKLQQPSQEYFAGLFRKLAAQPPVVTRETDDLFTILKNTAHFFRVIGKNNILLIKGILDQEKESYEDIVASLYRMTGEPDCLKSRLGLDIPKSAYYDYAGFFLNTMGGRLYLFRRDSKSRMIVNYYAILRIDRANQNGTNSHGIDLAPAISSLIGEIENGGGQLKLREAYLDRLYALKEKYPEPAQ